MRIFTDINKKVYEIKVIKSSKSTTWYSERIGKKFLAFLHYDDIFKRECWHVIHLSPKSRVKRFSGRYIMKSDVSRSKKLIGTFKIKKFVSKII